MSTPSAIILFPPAGGDNLCYHELKKQLKEAYTIFTVESNGLKNGVYCYDFKDLLNEYIAQITAHCPVGAYHLCGWSFGGLSALEVSRELIKREYTVLSTHLIDTYSPIVLKSDDETVELNKVKVIMNDLGGLFGIKAPLTDEHFLSTPKDTRLAIVLDFFKDNCYSAGKYFERRKEEFKSNLWAMYHFVPGFYDKNIFFYEAQQQVRGNSCTTREGWERWLKTENILDSIVAGNHYTMLQAPNIEELAEKIHFNILHTHPLKIDQLLKTDS